MSERVGSSEEEGNQPYSKNGPNGKKGTGLQRMGVKRSDAEGGTEMDAV